MSDTSELDASIQQYKTQLIQVENALSLSNSEAEKSSLQSLKSDLEELINLTKQTLNDATGETSKNTDSSSADDEMALFMNEIKSLDAAVSSNEKCDGDNDDEEFDEKLRSIKDTLQSMVGQKCSAPHDHAWGARMHHNAIICALDGSRDYDLADINSFRLRILFTNPTHREMVPCAYFLDGDCRFDADKCRFSHGELIPFGDLKEYKEPDFTKLKRNCSVLAKQQDRMWHKAKVLCANFVEKSCRVRLEQQKKEIDCNFEDLFPLSSDDDTSDSSDSESDLDDINEMRRAYLIEKSLLTPAADQALGEWEKHTRGIGSKLMQKMGYIIGTGLGSMGEGIITPISAQILPPGRSLDHCMELREAANGDKNLFSVERNMKKMQKKQEAKNVKAYEREKAKVDIFSFLNDNILTTNSNTKEDTHNQGLQRKNDFKNHTNKNLNVESLKIAEEIKKKEREILKVKEAMRRHTNNSEVHKRLQGQLNLKNEELFTLKKSETSVSREQMSRKHKDKLSVF